MKTLKMLAADVISSSLVQVEDIYKLEIPSTLYKDIETAYTDSWRERCITKKRKAGHLRVDNLKSRRDCPYCGRANFKRLISHITRNNACHKKYKMQA